MDKIGQKKFQLHNALWESRRVLNYPGSPSRKLTQWVGFWTKIITMTAVVWTLCELPVEILIARTPPEIIVVVIGRALWISLALCALSSVKLARPVFIFFTALWTIVIAYKLPLEYGAFPVGFFLSAVECILKGMTFLAFGLNRSDSVSSSRRLT